MDKIMSHIPQPSALNAAIAFTALWTFIKLIRMSRRRVRTTRFRGPPSPSFLYGVGKTLLEADDPSSIYESWAEVYGAIYEAPSALGQHRTVLHDPKAVAHFFAKETWTYGRTPVAKKSIELSFGRGLFWADGESHRRHVLENVFLEKKKQRKSLTPAFSNAAIRKLTPIFFDSAHKVSGAWNALIESSGEDGAVIDVQNWMNHVSMDSIGLAGFSHDFGTLDGKHTPVSTIFDTFSSSSSASALPVGLTLMAQVFPFLMRAPTSRSKLVWKLNSAMEEISNVLLARTKKEIEMGIVGEEEKSIIGLLIKGQSFGSEFHLSKEEVLAQMRILLLAGYETTSISLTWALIELSRNPDIQTRLRNEVLAHGSDLGYDQLFNDLPYLDAVVHEILRIHAPVRELTRIAVEDDVIPLSEPLRTASGQMVENVSVAKGTTITIPMASINRSTAFWGEDAKVFRPSRWLDDEHVQGGIPEKAQEIQGHRHLLTFSDGPRICLGKNFAVAEFKAVLSVLVKNFVFESRDGVGTKIEMARGILPRPQVAGEVGCKVPLRVKPYVG